MLNERKPEENNGENINISLSKKSFRHLVLIIAFAVILFWGVTNFQSLLSVVKWLYAIVSPFLIGLCIAFIVNTLLVPLENLWNKIFKKAADKVKLRRGICLALSFILVFTIIFAVVFMIAPQFVETVSSFINMVPGYIENLELQLDALTKWLDNYGIVLPEIELNGNETKSLLTSLVNNYGDSVLNTTVNVTTSIFGGVVTAVLAIAFSVYVLAQKNTLSRQFRRLLYAVMPRRRADKICGVLNLTNQTFYKFVTGQCIEAVIIGVLCFIGMLIFGFPYAGIISVLVGFTALIPVFGAFFGTAVGAFLILLVNPLKALLFVVFFIVLQQLEGNLIYPKVVGKSVGLPGIWVLFAVTVGGNAFGIVGMLFAVPLCSVIYCLLKEYVAKRLRHKHIEIEE